MGRTVEVAPGVVYTDVPDDVGDAEVRARAIAEGDIPDPGNGFSQFFIGAGKFFADRSGGLIANETPAPDTLPAALGGIAPAAAAGFLGGASVLGQAGIGAGLEAIREGSTAGSIIGQGVLSGAATGLTNMAGRVMRGALTAFKAQRAATAPVLAKIGGGVDDVLARTAAGAGGFQVADNINRQVLNKMYQRALGLGGTSDVVDDVVFAEARQGIAQLYNQALPTKPVNAAAAKALLAEIPPEAGPAVKEALAVIESAGDTIEPLGWQRVHSALREFRPLLVRSPWATWTQKLDDAITALDQGAAEAGGDRALLGIANQRYKLLSIGEEINSLVETGNVPAGELFRKLGARGWKGFGKRAAAENYTAGLLPETAQLFEVSKALAAEGRRLAVGSPTASRAALLGPAVVAGGGYLTGDLDAREAAGMAALGLVPRAAGTALLAEGTRGGLAGLVGQAAGQAVGSEAR